jgi:hypothetical protein
LQNAISPCVPDEALEVFLFTHDADYATAGIAGGITGIVVDWEHCGKADRQRGWNTDVSHGTDEDLGRIRARVRGHVVCRINNTPQRRRAETERAADLGADEIWLPMVRSVAEVEECLAALPGSSTLGILCETTEAIDLAARWAKLPLSRVYIGLNDLHIDRRAASLFSPLCDGTIDTFRRSYTGPGFGFSGVTRPDRGRPIPCRLLMAEMARHGCDFVVARRSFRADVPIGDIGDAVRSIRQVYANLRHRDAKTSAADHAELCVHVARHACVPGT